MLFVLFLFAFLAHCEDLPRERELFEQFKKEYKRSYDSVEENSYRFKVFVESLQQAEEWNRDEWDGAIYGVTKFSDLTKEERARYLNSVILKEQEGPKCDPYPRELGLQNISAIDWREKGAVSPIKDQGPKCGSCYCFSAIGCMEGAHFVRTGELLSFAAQQPLDCCTTTYGCGGGWPNAVFKYSFDTGVEQDSDYPYKAVQNECTFDKSKVKACFNQCFDLKGENEEMADALMTRGPIAAALNANALFTYKGGVSKRCLDYQLDHAVLIVGYDQEGNGWIIKNSWGSDWGEDGFFRIEFGVDCMNIAGESSIIVSSDCEK